MVAAFHIFWAGWHRCKGFFPQICWVHKEKSGAKPCAFQLWIGWAWNQETPTWGMAIGQLLVPYMRDMTLEACCFLKMINDQLTINSLPPPLSSSKTGWWFQTFFIFTPNLGEMIPIWLYNIFQRGWFNHHLENSWMLLRWRGDMKFTNTLVLSVGPSSPCLRRVFWDSLESLETWVPRREPTAPTPDK